MIFFINLRSFAVGARSLRSNGRTIKCTSEGLCPSRTLISLILKPRDMVALLNSVMSIWSGVCSRFLWRITFNLVVDAHTRLNGGRAFMPCNILCITIILYISRWSEGTARYFSDHHKQLSHAVNQLMHRIDRTACGH